jgi:hypothetical protein
LVARTATANIVNIVCPKEEGIILTKLQQRTNQEARFVIFIPGVFEAEGTRARLGLASGLCPGRLRGAAGIFKKTAEFENADSVQVKSRITPRNT